MASRKDKNKPGDKVSTPWWAFADFKKEEAIYLIQMVLSSHKVTVYSNSPSFFLSFFFCSHVMKVREIWKSKDQKVVGIYSQSQLAIVMIRKHTLSLCFLIAIGFMIWKWWVRDPRRENEEEYYYFIMWCCFWSYIYGKRKGN